MGIVNYTYNRSTSGGEIITHLINSTDGTGLHFDGSAGSIDIASPPDLGTKFSFEFIVQADSWGSTQYLSDFGPTAGAGRLSLASFSAESYNLAIYDTGYHSFGVAVLDDLKVHHLVVTIDGTAAILYDNGNQVGTTTIVAPTIDSAADATLGSYVAGGSNWDGTFYRARFFNRTLSASDVTTLFEKADVSFADQYGSQTEKVVNGAFAADTDWTKGTGWTIGSGVATHAAGSASYLSQTIATLKAGATYRVTFTISGATAGELRPEVGGTAGSFIGTNATHTEDIVCGSSTTFQFYGHTAFAGSIDNVQVVQLGCVSDYDLAFANPTQSLMVQDRAGAADGTSSATGVVQVTPIEQLNSKSARIGTTAATPADGDLLVSGNAGIGADTNFTYSKLEVKAATDATGFGITSDNTQPLARNWGFITNNSAWGSLDIMYSSAKNTTPYNTSALSIDSAGLVDVKAGLRISTAGQELQWVAGQTKITGATSYMIFDVNSAERLRIDTNGQLGLGGSPPTFYTGIRAMSIGVGGVISGVTAGNPNLTFTDNSYIDAAGNNVYRTTNPTTKLEQYDGGLTFLNAPSGTAGATATYVNRFSISSTGVLTKTGTSGNFAIDASGTTAEMSYDGPNYIYANAGSSASLKIQGQSQVSISTGATQTDRLTISSTGVSTFSNGIDVDSTGNFVKLEAYQNVSVADDATISLSSGSCSSAIVSVYETSGGVGGVFFITYSGTAILIASNGSVAATDSDGNMCVYKSAASHTATFKNRMGSTKTFSVAQLGGYLV